MRLRPLWFVMLLATLLIAAVPARAEWVIDAYAGPAFTQNGRFSGGPAASATTDFNTVVSGGARAGYYLDFFPYLGLALDVSHYQPDGNFGGGGTGFSYDARVTALSFDAMARLPLMTSKTFPYGRLQPYLTVGPGVYFSHMEINPTPSFGHSDSDASVGVKAGAGISWLWTENFGFMAEYRFSHFNAHLVHFDTKFDTHRLQVGWTLHF